MTKAEIIEIVLLRVSGGRLSADVDVRREDISALVAPAIAAALQQYLDEGLNRDRAVLNLSGSKGHQPGAIFSVTYTLDPEEDTSRSKSYVALPGRLLLVANNLGLVSVHPLAGDDYPCRIVGGQSEIQGLEATGIVFAWHELVDGNSRIYFSYLPNPSGQLIVKASIDPAGYGDNDNLPLPSGVDMVAIDLLTRHFLGQAGAPQDQMLTDTEENAGATN